MKFSEHIKIFLRAVKMFFHCSKAFTVCTFLNSLISAVIPYVSIYFSARLIDALYLGESVQTVALYVLLTVGIVFALKLLNTYISSRKSIASQNISRGESWMYSEKAMQMAYESIENRDVSLLRERIKTESQTGYNRFYLYACIDRIVSNTASIIAALSLTFSFFVIESIPLYMKLLFVLGVILTVVCGILTTVRDKKLDAKFNDMNINMNLISFKYYEYIEDYSSGKDIRLYDMAEGLSDFGAQNDKLYYEKILKKNIKQSVTNLIDTVMNNLLKFGTYMMLIYGALLGSISVGSIAQYVSSVMLMLGAILRLIYAIQTALENNKYLKRYFSYFDIKNNMYQGSLTIEKRDDNEYYVEFRNVSFKYPNTDTYALRDVNLKFKIGEKLAVVGMNGSGKTTFIKLMCRLYDPTDGEILLNGVNIKKYDYDEYISLFSVVFQDFRLFSFSLGENVAASSTYDGERVKRCLEQAGFGERLSSMPNGVETYVYKNFDNSGIEISGGEAQKIALARALYKDAPFIILDEPTAALDPISEYAVYLKFNKIAGDKTAIYISHRLASCRFCDKIAVFDNGKIVQTGDHNNLLSQENGKYYELWHAQAQYYT